MIWETIKETMLMGMTEKQYQENVVDNIIPYTIQHLYIVLITMIIVISLGVFLSILLTRAEFKKYSGIIMGFVNFMQSVPTMVLLVLVMPFLGIGLKPALLALCVICIMPILKNSIVGINEVDQNIKEAAKGMGMTPRQVMVEVEIPLALPIILTGIRTSTVLAIASGTLAAMIGSGGLGHMIFLGLMMNWKPSLIVGAAITAALAVIADYILGKLSMHYVPPGTIVEN